MVFVFDGYCCFFRIGCNVEDLWLGIEIVILLVV